MRTLRRLAVLAVLVTALVWRVLPDERHWSVALPVTEPRGAAADRLIIEPDDGMTPIYALLTSARLSLDMTIYEILDPTAETLLAQDAARGVRVRVIMDGRLERSRNGPAFSYLTSRGVQVVWASDRYFVTHEKTFVIDRRKAVIMSLNLVSNDYATTRDAAVVDDDRADVAAIESVFEADLHGAPAGTPAADDLVWSPGQSHADIVALIRSARRSVAVESEELSSPAVVDALVDAARRGVSVSLAMTYQPKWVKGLDALAAAGGTVRVMYGEVPLYIHAKLLVIDAGMPGARALVGSQNLADTSLLSDRELGVVLLSPAVVGQVAAVVASDLRDGRSWT
jgi:phosphatidylserine/phosphatidylglycerophosphate/cardiolipin synthase-like enzyme